MNEGKALMIDEESLANKLKAYDATIKQRREEKDSLLKDKLFQIQIQMFVTVVSMVVVTLNIVLQDYPNKLVLFGEVVVITVLTWFATNKYHQQKLCKYEIYRNLNPIDYKKMAKTPEFRNRVKEIIDLRYGKIFLSILIDMLIFFIRI